jgi:hypothetical protein
VQNLLQHLLLTFNGTSAAKLTPIILSPLPTSATADTKHNTGKKICLGLVQIKSIQT